jgi:hypothetical protein
MRRLPDLVTQMRKLEEEIKQIRSQLPGPIPPPK